MSVEAPQRQSPSSQGVVALTSTVLTVAEVLNEDLRIPDYQRPYKWTIRNADQLLHDIWAFRRRGDYRLGTVILHDRDIVDGQQRYFTLTLLLIALLETVDPDRERRGVTLDDLRQRELPTHGASVSAANLQRNFQHLKTVLRSWSPDDCEALVDFVLDNCQVVVLRLSELDAAFQMFDSQNTRGRALFPTDLLKAFHIREMTGSTVPAELRTKMVNLWESIPPESVNSLFSDYLFKIKRWANGHNVPSQGFSARHVAMFKGIREGNPNNALNRWSMPYLYAKNYTDDFRAENDTLIRYGALRAVEYPFQIDQPVLNGETFFEMVAHYHRMGLALGLFPEDDHSGIEGSKAPFSTKTMETLRSLRGDLQKYRNDKRFDFAINLLECLLLYYLDRFDGQQLERAIQVLLRYTMGLRASMKQLQRATVNNYALGSSPRSPLEGANHFNEIRQALSPADYLLRALPPEPEQWGSYDSLRVYFTTSSYGGHDSISKVQ